MAHSWHANHGVRGSPALVQGKILPRPRRTLGGETAGPTRPYARGHGGGTPAWTALQVLIALVPGVPRYWRERATPPWGFILSPSATLRVAGLALSWPMARG